MVVFSVNFHRFTNGHEDSFIFRPNGLFSFFYVFRSLRWNKLVSLPHYVFQNLSKLDIL